MVTKFHHNMEPECSLTCSQQPVTEQISSLPNFTHSLSYNTFNIIRYLCPCPGLNFLHMSRVRHFMIHNLHISYDFISSPIFVPHQLQHNNLFTLSLRYLINADRNYGYSQRVAIRCEVSWTLSTMKSAVFTTITWSQTEQNQFLHLLFTFCFFNCSIFCPYTLNPKIWAESFSETSPT